MSFIKGVNEVIFSFLDTFAEDFWKPFNILKMAKDPAPF